MNSYGESGKVLVSVLCYNHGAYIEQCLDSIFGQKCNFPFEVFVFDDVSTDNSWNVILKYKEKYGDRMIIYRPECNQFAQKKLNIYKIMAHSMQGYKYVAICEGDDYWSSKDKLQKQYDGMEKNESCSICVCATDSYDEIHHQMMGRTPRSAEDEIISGEKAIVDTLRWSLFWGANTFFMRNKYLMEANMDTIFWKYIAGDMSYILYLAMHGSVLYLGECMAVKRRYNEGSVSEKTVKNEITDNWFDEDIEWILSFNEMTKRKYEDSVQRYILWRKIRSHYIKNGQVTINKYVNDSNGKLYKNEFARKGNRLYIRLIKAFYKKDETGFIKKERQWMEKEWKRVQKKERYPEN